VRLVSVMSLNSNNIEAEILAALGSKGFGPLSVDDFLGGKVRLIQLQKGYRAGMDAVLLAASIHADPGDKVLDLGAGTGGVAICLAARCPGVSVDGLEIQKDLIALAEKNVALNRLTERVVIHQGSVLENPAVVPENFYDHVFANPPYLEGGCANHSPNETKDLAHIGEENTCLEDWVKFALTRVKNKGTVSFIFRADRVDELMSALHRRAGEAVIFPLWPRAGEVAKRVIVQARKGLHGGATLAPGLVLHGQRDRYSKEAEAILRDGGAIDLARYHRAKGP
jgi:tRNA1(Val) A37 N6-methylase TrmN6